MTIEILSEDEQRTAHETESGHIVSPFRYCPECNWLPLTEADIETEQTDSEKLNAILAYSEQTAADIAAIRVMVSDAMTKVEPFLAKLSKSPILGMLGIR